MVTGASTGIGYATVVRLARAGFRVFAGVRKPDDAERLRSALGERGTPVQMDVTDGEAVRRAASQVEAQLGESGLSGLVNNAGFGVAAPVEHLAPDVLRRLFEVNVFGQIAVTQAFLPLIRKSRGRIVNMGSVGSQMAMPFGGALCATKSAFRSLNDALRLELHPFGIAVVMLEPASIRTPAVDKMLGDPEAAIRALPAEGTARYGRMLREFLRRAAERENKGSPPEVVAEAVYHALVDRRPPPHVPVGKDARLLVTLPRILGDRALDRLRWRLFGIPATSP